LGPGWCGLAMLLALVRDVSERLGLVQQVTQRALHQRPKRDEDLEGKGGGDVRGGCWPGGLGAGARAAAGAGVGVRVVYSG
jgi:hypothetical protein